MGDSRRLPKFGQIDLDLAPLDAAEDAPSTKSRSAASGMSGTPSTLGTLGTLGTLSTSGARPARTGTKFGELDLEFGDGSDDAGGRREAASTELPQESSHRLVGNERSAQDGRRGRAAMDSWSDADEPSGRHPGGQHTKVTRRAFEAVQAESPTRIGSFAEAAAPLAPTDDVTTSSRSGQSGGPSASRIAARDGRVAAMRELYASGDVDGALALAADIASTSPPPPPDSGTYDRAFAGDPFVLGMTDPFGGLIPVDDSSASDDWGTAISDVSAQIAAVVVDGLRAVADLRVPRVLKNRTELSKLPIDHRAGFLLAHIDGMQTMEEILDVCAMPEQEALELIAQLEAMGVITVG